MAMHNPQASLSVPRGTQMGGRLLANMLADWLKNGSGFSSGAEAAYEPQDHRTAPPQAGVRVPAPIDPRPSAAPSREHGAAICSARESPGVGLEPSCDPRPRPRPRNLGCADGGERRLQDLGGGCLDGAGGCSICPGSLAAGPL